MTPLLFIAISSLLICGIINKVRALLSGRKGCRLFQPLYTVSALLRKGSVYSNQSTVLTRVVPSLNLAVVIIAALFIPLGQSAALISFDGDFILWAYLLALGRLAMILAAFESGSAFQGMGASRELLYSMLLEPCFFLLIGTLAMVTGFWSFNAIFAQFDNLSINMLVLSIVVGYACLNLAMAENGRMPVDDTRTHLELTMIHEAMILDTSGVDLAYIYISGWIKLAMFGLLTANMLIPPQQMGNMMILYFAVAILGYGIIMGVCESVMVRNRMSKNATYLVTISAIGLLGLVVAYILSTNAFPIENI